MRHYIENDHIHYYIDTPDSHGWTWEEGGQTARPFNIHGAEIVRWGKPHQMGVYFEPPTSVPQPVRRVRVPGRGYGGGHNTAARLGWFVSYPPPEKEALLWWDDTRQGTWTGYWPATVSLLRKEAGE
jgi:hypothetical protein